MNDKPLGQQRRGPLVVTDELVVDAIVANLTPAEKRLAERLYGKPEPRIRDEGGGSVPGWIMARDKAKPRRRTPETRVETPDGRAVYLKDEDTKGPVYPDITIV